MSPLSYVYSALASFRQLFSRHRTFVLFVMVVLALLAAPELVGVTSFCRFWDLGEVGYHRLLRLFRSHAWDLAALTRHWFEFVLGQGFTLLVNGRIVFLGDHSQVVKDARRMPAVVTLRCDSETQSKPSYFRGQMWGVVGLLMGSWAASICLPVIVRLHLGFRNVLGAAAADDPDTMNTRLVKMALILAIATGVSGYLVLDAFFSVGPVFLLANSSWSLQARAPWLHILTRAKRNYVGFEQPTQAGPTYGRKLVLAAVFETHSEQFEHATVTLYGKSEEISYLALNLLWKPVQGVIRFILVESSRGRIVLMSSDLDLDPLTAAMLYASRIRIEGTIAWLKHLVCAFAFHFWTQYLPPHPRRPRKNTALEVPAPAGVATVKACWEACERYAQLACVALGLVQLVALKFGTTIWARFHCYLRTSGTRLPSEAVTRVVLARAITADYQQVAPHAMMSEIRRHIEPITHPPPAPSSSERCQRPS